LYDLSVLNPSLYDAALIAFIPDQPIALLGVVLILELYKASQSQSTFRVLLGETSPFWPHLLDPGRASEMLHPWKDATQFFLSHSPALVFTYAHAGNNKNLV